MWYIYFTTRRCRESSVQPGSSINSTVHHRELVRQVYDDRITPLDSTSHIMPFAPRVTSCMALWQAADRWACRRVQQPVRGSRPATTFYVRPYSKFSSLKQAFLCAKKPSKPKIKPLCFQAPSEMLRWGFCSVNVDRFMLISLRTRTNMHAETQIFLEVPMAQPV